MLFSAFWFTFFFVVNLYEWIGKYTIYQFKDYVSWICNLFYFVWKTTHFNLRRDEWDDVQKKLIRLFYFFWYVVYVGNVSGKNVLCTKLERKIKVKVNQEIQ